MATQEVKTRYCSGCRQAHPVSHFDAEYKTCRKMRERKSRLERYGPSESTNFRTTGNLRGFSCNGTHLEIYLRKRW